MSRFALIGLAVAVTLVGVAGCFYTEQVNQRPSLDIHRRNEGPYFRGDMNKTIELDAVSNDPEGHNVTYHWRGYACTVQGECDQAPYFEKSDQFVEIAVPTKRFDSAEPIKGILVKLEGKDAYGAVARPVQELWVDVDNAPPMVVAFQEFSNFGHVVDTDVTIFVEVVDTDDRDRVPDVTWDVFSPMNQPTYTFVDPPMPATPSHGGYAFGKILHAKPNGSADGTGKYTIAFTASDGIAVTPVANLDVMIKPDTPPCLRTMSPLVAVAPAALPITDPTLFQVHYVYDDLDPYPTANDGVRGPTKFTWSLLAPGGSRQVLTGVSGNSVAIDPASYQPGDILELRVEIADRNNTPIMCADTNASCSVISDNNCLQRQTWRVEVR